MKSWSDRFIQESNPGLIDLAFSLCASVDRMTLGKIRDKAMQNVVKLRKNKSRKNKSRKNKYTKYKSIKNSKLYTKKKDKYFRYNRW